MSEKGLTPVLRRPESTPPVLQHSPLLEEPPSPSPPSTASPPHSPRRRQESTGSVLASEASTSSSSPFEVYVHQGGALDGMVWMGGEEEDEEQELVQFYEQGRITEDQLGRIRRNSA